MEQLRIRLAGQVNLTCASSKQNRLLRMLHMVWTVLAYRKQTNLVVIDVYSTLNFYYALTIAWLCQLIRLPYIAYLRGGNLPHRITRSPGLSKTIFSKANKIIAPSTYLQQAFEAAGYPCTIIPNFIDLEIYPYRLRETVAPKLLWVRSFDAIYNPEMAIRVLKLLREVYPEASLCMVGPNKDGSLHTCKALAERLGISVIFTGALKKTAWIKLANEYDIFINTTNIDNTPVSVIEAMALGLPVVSTNVGGIPFLIEDGKDGLLSAPEGEASMYEHICQLIQNPEMARSMAINARKKVESFDWKIIEKQWLDLFT